MAIKIDKELENTYTSKDGSIFIDFSAIDEEFNKEKDTKEEDEETENNE